jgi:hypothetical protein
VTAVTILDKNGGDAPQFPGLVEATAEAVEVETVCADKLCTTVANDEVVDALGGTPYAPFKVNRTGSAGGVFEKMFYFFLMHRQKFLQTCHARSNIE